MNLPPGVNGLRADGIDTPMVQPPRCWVNEDGAECNAPADPDLCLCPRHRDLLREPELVVADGP